MEMQYIPDIYIVMCNRGSSHILLIFDITIGFPSLSFELCYTPVLEMKYLCCQLN